MATNAPYYQLRGGQLEGAPNNPNAVSQFVPESDEYDLSTSAADASPLDNLHASMYPGQSARQTSVEITLEENHHLAELLEAATTAQTMAVSDADAAKPVGGKRKRTLHVLDNNGTPHDSSPGASPKKQRVVVSTDPYLAENGRRHLLDDGASTEPSPSDESFPSDPRAAGVHSAAALFRPVSETAARKHTRPPMSKLFLSLQLTPESFLQLQAEAKAYMLDTKHPARQNCVGNRGKGDTDMVKLRLFNCVRDFLSDGAGDKFFGEHVEKPGKQDSIEAACALRAEQTTVERLVWPSDGNKIISLVTPLMRRMVTNERQRQYAIETRKGGAKKKDKEETATATSFPRTLQNTGLGVEQQPQPSLDPNLSLTNHPSHSTPLSPQSEATTNGSPLKEKFMGHYITAGTDVANLVSTVFDSKMLKVSESLPSEGQTAPNLSRINVFLILAAHGARPDIKLEETRITIQPAEKHLACYEWDKFLEHVLAMLRRAEAKYSDNQASPATPANLRGLAAAANALSITDTNKTASAVGSASPALPERDTKEGEVDNSNGCPDTEMTASSPAPMSPIRPPASASEKDLPYATNGESESKSRPHYIIKTVGPEGWKIIANAKDWHDMLMQKAFAIWADGTCNVVVELVDLPVLGSSAQGKEENHAEVEGDT